MNRNTRQDIWLLLLAIPLFAGCQCIPHGRPATRDVAPDVIVDSGITRHLWLFIPIPRLALGQQPSGYPAEVALPPEQCTTNRMRIWVMGEVVCPGELSVLEGSTVLQAIGQAGGFTSFAFAPKPRLVKAAGNRLQLQMHSWQVQPQGYRQVWYERQGPPESGQENAEANNRPVDWLLESGDRIIVTKAIF